MQCFLVAIVASQVPRKIVSCNMTLFIQHFTDLGNLNDGPKDGEDRAVKPTAAPFESQSRYSGIVRGIRMRRTIGESYMSQFKFWVFSFHVG